MPPFNLYTQRNILYPRVVCLWRPGMPSCQPTENLFDLADAVLKKQSVASLVSVAGRISLCVSN